MSRRRPLFSDEIDLRWFAILCYGGSILLGEAGGLGRGHLELVDPELGHSEVTGVDRLDLPLD